MKILQEKLKNMDMVDKITFCLGEDIYFKKEDELKVVEGENEELINIDNWVGSSLVPIFYSCGNFVAFYLEILSGYREKGA